MPQSHRRAIVRVSFELLEELLHLQGAQLQVVGVYPADPGYFPRREAQLVLEGPRCPEVWEGMRYPEMQLVMRWEDGQPKVSLE